MTIAEPLGWRKAKACNKQACVEIAAVSDGRFAIRDSKNPAGPVLFYNREEFQTFIDAAKSGDFDDML